MEYVTLSNGVKMPIIGYGVYQISKEDCERCVLEALEVGYRHIDTAQSYFNEEEVGNAIKKSGIKREELFITSKVWIEHYGYEECKQSVYESLEKLGLEYIDLMLLHQPFNDYYGAWRALEDLYEEGKIKAIGISNFYPDRVVDICSFARIKPMINQIETHPLFQREIDHKWMEKYHVQHEAWASFGEGRGGLFTNSLLEAIGQKYGKTPAQVMLRWAIQRNIVVLPKSVHKDRMIQNIDIFDFSLSADDMDKIKELDTNTSSFFSHQDPNMVEWFVKMVEERKKNHTHTQKNW